MCAAYHSSSDARSSSKSSRTTARSATWYATLSIHSTLSHPTLVTAHAQYIPLDYYTREPRGFAYVEFEDERDARYALKELDGARLWGQTIHLEWAKSDRKTPKEMRVQTKEEGRDRGRPRDGYDRHRGDRGMGRPPMGGRGGYGGGGGGGAGMGGRGRYASYSRSPSPRGRGRRRRYAVLAMCVWKRLCRSLCSLRKIANSTVMGNTSASKQA